MTPRDLTPAQARAKLAGLLNDFAGVELDGPASRRAVDLALGWEVQRLANRCGDAITLCDDKGTPVARFEPKADPWAIVEPAGNA